MLEGLDLLRAIAIVIVVFYHAALFGFELPGRVDRFGWVGVDLFFALSGYLIGGQLCAQLASQGTIRLRRFLWRRALRIMPAYLTVLAVYLLVPSWREYPSISPTWKFLVSVQNIELRGGTAFSHAWSLAVEDQFYLTLPAVLLLAWRWPRAGRALPAAVVCLGLAVRALLAATHLDGGAMSGSDWMRYIYYPTWSRLDPLVLGVTLAAVQRFRPRWWALLTEQGHRLLVPGLLAVAAAVALGEGRPHTVAICIWQFPLLAIGVASLLLAFLSPGLPLSRRPIRGADFIASIAYSVYLSHKLVIHAVLAQLPTLGVVADSWRGHVLVQVTIYLSGTALFLAVERPFLRWRERLSANPQQLDSRVTGTNSKPFQLSKLKPTLVSRVYGCTTNMEAD